MSNKYVGQTCPYCQAVIKPQDDVVKCDKCGVAHHKECWDANGGCTTVSCAGTVSPQTVARPTPARKPPTSATGSPRPAPRKSRKLRWFLVLLLLTAGGVGYYLGWYYWKLPFPFETVAGWRLMPRREYNDLKRIQWWLRANTDGSEPVYAMGLPLLPEHGREVFYADDPVTEEMALDWCRRHRNGLIIMVEFTAAGEPLGQELAIIWSMESIVVLRPYLAMDATASRVDSPLEPTEDRAPMAAERRGYVIVRFSPALKADMVRKGWSLDEYAQCLQVRRNGVVYASGDPVVRRLEADICCGIYSCTVGDDCFVVINNLRTQRNTPVNYEWRFHDSKGVYQDMTSTFTVEADDNDLHAGQWRPGDSICPPIVDAHGGTESLGTDE